MRDIIDKLPEILDGVRRIRSGEAYRDHIREIKRHWKTREMVDSNPSSVGDDATPAGQLIQIPAVACQSVEELLQKFDEIEAQETTGALLTRALYRRSHSTGTALSSRLVDSFQDSRKWFVKWAHLLNEIGDSPSHSELLRQVESFEGIMFSFVGQYFAGTAELDEILRETNR